MYRKIITGVLVAVLGAAAVFSWRDENTAELSEGSATSGGALVEVALPDVFSENAKIGKLAFEAKCVSCHGTNAAGQDGVAPPLVHVIYEPNHHGDESFQRAAGEGVRGHHWPFGDMAPVEGVTRGDMKMIIAYVRELQRENGIN